MTFNPCPKPKPKNVREYGAVKVRGTGKGGSGGYPSYLEASVHQILILRERANDIKDLRRQPTVVLQDGPANERVAWKPDFGFTRCKDNQPCYAEAKGWENEVYALKLKLYRRNGDRPLEIWKGSHKDPQLVEIVIPRGFKK